MIRLLTIACLCAAGLLIAITWKDAATTLKRATEPRSALTSPSDPLNRDVAAAREEIRKPKEAGRQTSAAQSARAIADLSAAREETRTLRARHGEAEKKVSDVVEKQVQEPARAEALDRDLTAAGQEIQTLETRQSDGAQQVSAVGQQLAQERARAEALDRDLAAARQEIQTLKVDQANAAQDASAAERTRARERARGEALAGNLAAAREENRTTVRADAVADNTSVPQPELPGNENDESALHNSNDPGPTSHAMAAAVPSANTLAAVQQSDTPNGAEPVPAAPGDAIHHLDPNEIASSLRRGDALIASGDLAAARLVLRRAADAGDARAAMTLAETYDPAILEKLGVHGVVPDLAMARGWYEKAKKLGATEATQRLELLASKQH
jgi:cell division protein FtsB